MFTKLRLEHTEMDKLRSKKSVVSLVKREGRDIRYSNLFIHIDCDIRGTDEYDSIDVQIFAMSEREKNLVRFDVRKILLEVSSSVLECWMADELCRRLKLFFAFANNVWLNI